MITLRLVHYFAHNHRRKLLSIRLPYVAVDGPFKVTITHELSPAT